MVYSLMEFSLEKLAWLSVWSRYPSIAQFEAIRARYGSLQRYCQHHSIPLADAVMDQVLAWASQPGCSVVLATEPEYPELLAHIAQAPPVLFVRGALGALKLRQVAMVGARKATAEGIRDAEGLARDLVQQGWAVTSGLAWGIDAAAHRGALSAGGVTLAVMGTGLETIYPKEHRRLAETIVAQGGAWVSELPLSYGPRPAHFPRRNRLISGLAQGVFVVEAAEKSGSLCTARYALEQGREVFARPGAVRNPLSRGCHALIRQGAKLVETVSDILEELHPNVGLVALCRPQAHTISSSVLE